MRYFFGSLAIVTAALIGIKPTMAVDIIATSLLIGGLLALLPEGSDSETISSKE